MLKSIESASCDNHCQKGEEPLVSPLFTVLYNIVLTIVLTLAVGCIYFLYFHKKHPGLIALGAAFCAYLLDNIIVFCTEIIPEFAGVYDKMFLNTPSVKTIYFIILIASLLFALHSVMPAFSKNLTIGLICIHAALLICIPMISQDDWMVFIYYSTTQFVVIGASIWGLAVLSKNPAASTLGDLKGILWCFLFMSILILMEDSVVIFYVDRYYGPGLKINNRNFSENLLYLGMAVHVLYSAHRFLMHATSAPTTEVTEPSATDRAQSDIYTFAVEYALTEREQEILLHLLQSRSQQEISDQLMIALGTVKTHIHNIYQKTGSSNRNQIIAKYHHFCSSENSDA